MALNLNPFDLSTRNVAGPGYIFLDGVPLGATREGFQGLVGAEDPSEPVLADQVGGAVAHARGTVTKEVGTTLVSWNAATLANVLGGAVEEITGGRRIFATYKQGLKALRYVEIFIRGGETGWRCQRFRGAVAVNAADLPAAGDIGLPIQIMGVLNPQAETFDGWYEYDPIAGAFALSSSTPTDSATGVAVSVSPLLVFNKPLFPNQFHYSLTNGIKLTTQSALSTLIAAAISFDYDPDRANGEWTDLTRLTINPTANLDASTAYRVSLPQILRSFDGIPMAAADTVDFTTAS
jgi:hypothetical protein